LEGQVTVVSIDGGCPGVNDVKAGAIGATSMQFPIKMAGDALQAINAFLKDGTKPTTTDGLDFTNTGVTLITDKAAPGVTSEPTSWGLENCWG
jgi:fructose transport system substrate-binding protein